MYLFSLQLSTTTTFSQKASKGEQVNKAFDLIRKMYESITATRWETTPETNPKLGDRMGPGRQDGTQEKVKPANSHSIRDQPGNKMANKQHRRQEKAWRRCHSMSGQLEDKAGQGKIRKTRPVARSQDGRDKLRDNAAWHSWRGQYWIVPLLWLPFLSVLCPAVQSSLYSLANVPVMVPRTRPQFSLSISSVHNQRFQIALWMMVEGLALWFHFFTTFGSIHLWSTFSTLAEVPIAALWSWSFAFLDLALGLFGSWVVWFQSWKSSSQLLQDSLLLLIDFRPVLVTCVAKICWCFDRLSAMSALPQLILVVPLPLHYCCLQL